MGAASDGGPAGYRASNASACTVVFVCRVSNRSVCKAVRIMGSVAYVKFGSPPWRAQHQERAAPDAGFGPLA
jgi:hypothetical protein